MGKHRKSQNSATSSSSRKIPNQVRSKIGPLVQKLLKKCVNVNQPVQKQFEEYKEIDAILREIQKHEKEFVLPYPQRAGNWEQFYTWCRENGAVFDGLSVKEFDKGNYGIVTDRNLQKNELMLTVPRKIMMSVEHAHDSKLGPLLKENIMLKSMPNVALALYLLTEFVDENSFWKPYLAILPSSYETILFMNIEELELLQKSPVFEESISICRSVARQYGYFYQLFQTNEYANKLDIAQCFTYDLYRWAVSTVMTRQNCVPSENQDLKSMALIPLWDMCNHANGDFSTDFSVEKNCLEAYSMTSYTTGEEVNIFYAPRSNAEFFVHNGFVYPENENDSVALKLNLSKNDPLYTGKNELCSSHGISLNGQFLLQKQNMVCEELLTFLKINVLKEDEMTEALKNKDLICKDSEKEKDIKQHALIFLRDRATLLLNCYKTTLEEDVERLKSSQTPCSKTAINLLMCEKKILADCIRFCMSSIT